MVDKASALESVMSQITISGGSLGIEMSGGYDRWAYRHSTRIFIA